MIFVSRPTLPSHLRQYPALNSVIKNLYAITVRQIPRFDHWNPNAVLANRKIGCIYAVLANKIIICIHFVPVSLCVALEGI